ncbi:hypothetical protein BDY21DRAFT_294800, partial [Lineolata rhizophorae]
PLRDHREAELVIYFVNHLAPLFDICDPDKHFASVVPERAAICPALLNAVFAASAKHLSRVKNYDSLVAVAHHQECLKCIAPRLSNDIAVMDENLLAAIIILRFFEEVEVPIFEPDRQDHLLGIRALIEAQLPSMSPNEFHQAAFWVGLRQEVYMAVIHQRPIGLNLDRLTFDRSFSPAADHVWANRMVLHLANVIQYCFGDDGNIATYKQLVEYSAAWMASKPPSFIPIFVEQPEGENMFPEVLLLSDSIVVGLQYYHLARILLIAHNPKIPRLGPAQRTAIRLMDDEIKSDVRVLCGIAKSINRINPAYATACMAIGLAGDRFTSRKEQDALYNILVRTEKEYAWCTSLA